ncbi:MAG: putative zinc-binding metallopeptidase [Planctomycetota bacterium]
MTDAELLETRMSDLPLVIEGTPLEQRTVKLCEELGTRGLKFRPHFWLSEEWFSPDGVPGIAIPFYLAHPRLIRLERKMLLEVEGGSQESCMRILRHEAGHAIDTAFRLSRRSGYRRTFGSPSLPYPDNYLPAPQSRKYVLHLEMWYAQAHPVEDFAETFAVWLRPGSRWRSRYRDWPAIEKLHWMHDTMKSIEGKKPVQRSRAKPYSLRSIRTTLAEHYRRKREHYCVEVPSIYDKDLRKLFSDDPADKHQQAASQFLRSIRTELRRAVAEWTGQYSYTVDQVIAEMIQRCRQLKLRLRNAPEKTKVDAMILIAVRVTAYLHTGGQRVAL